MPALGDGVTLTHQRACMHHTLSDLHADAPHAPHLTCSRCAERAPSRLPCEACFPAGSRAPSARTQTRHRNDYQCKYHKACALFLRKPVRVTTHVSRRPTRARQLDIPIYHQSIPLISREQPWRGRLARNGHGQSLPVNRPYAVCHALAQQQAGTLRCRGHRSSFPPRLDGRAAAPPG